jgi:hypothetical protein
MITGHDPGEWPVRVTAGEKLPRLSFAGGGPMGHTADA